MEHEYNKEAVLLSPWRLVLQLLQLLIIIFSVETAIMVFLSTLIP